MFKKWNKKLDKIGRNLDKEVSKAMHLENGAKISGLFSSDDVKRKETENQLKTILNEDEEVEEIVEVNNDPEGFDNLSSNEEERSEDDIIETIVENKVEALNIENNREVANTTSKVDSLANAVREYIQSHDTNPEMLEIIEDILFQANKDEVSYAGLCQGLFSLQDDDLSEMIIGFTATYEV